MPGNPQAETVYFIGCDRGMSKTQSRNDCGRHAMASAEYFECDDYFVLEATLRYLTLPWPKVPSPGTRVQNLKARGTAAWAVCMLGLTK